MNKIPKIILIIIIIFIVVWLASLAKCEYLTYKYYDEFRYEYLKNSMMGNIQYFKVLSYSKNYAEVYYVSENMSCADILSFKKINNEWLYDSWVDTVWSDTGSASDVVWPYWWHFIYGGF